VDPNRVCDGGTAVVIFYLEMSARAALTLLGVSLVATWWLARGLGVPETIGMLVCGLVAGAALAAWTAARQKTR
jgi:hypothetical protein